MRTVYKPMLVKHLDSKPSDPPKFLCACPNCGVSRARRSSSWSTHTTGVIEARLVCTRNATEDDCHQLFDVEWRPTDGVLTLPAGADENIKLIEFNTKKKEDMTNKDDIQYVTKLINLRNRMDSVERYSRYALCETNLLQPFGNRLEDLRNAADSAQTLWRSLHQMHRDHKVSESVRMRAQQAFEPGADPKALATLLKELEEDPLEKLREILTALKEGDAVLVRFQSKGSTKPVSEVRGPISRYNSTIRVDITDSLSIVLLRPDGTFPMSIKELFAWTKEGEAAGVWFRGSGDSGPDLSALLDDEAPF